MTTTPTDLTRIRRNAHYEARCRRCRHRWEEIHDTPITNGIGMLVYCPRCFSRAIERKVAQ